MALINQKYGRQGQADYTLYALARQQSGVFHDITLGTNDVLCMRGSPPPGFPPVPNCTVPYTNQYFPDTYSFGFYPAGPGRVISEGNVRFGFFAPNQQIELISLTWLPVQSTVAHAQQQTAP